MYVSSPTSWVDGGDRFYVANIDGNLIETFHVYLFPLRSLLLFNSLFFLVRYHRIVLGYANECLMRFSSWVIDKFWLTLLMGTRSMQLSEPLMQINLSELTTCQPNPWCLRCMVESRLILMARWHLFCFCFGRYHVSELVSYFYPNIFLQRILIVVLSFLVQSY